MSKNKSVGELLEITKDILSKNEYCKLSGSLALSLGKLKIRREPKDIDIYLPYGKIFTPLECMVPWNNDDNEKYDNEYYERTSYKYMGVGIDVFTPVDEFVPELYGESIDGINCVLFFEIMKLKILHAYGDHYTRFKHKDDIVFMMSLIA